MEKLLELLKDQRVSIIIIILGVLLILTGALSYVPFIESTLPQEMDLVGRFSLFIVGGILLIIGIKFLKRETEREMDRETERPPGIPSSLRIYLSFFADGVSDLFKSVSKSIVIIDSWFGDSTFLASCIQDSKARGDEVKVDVYMLDPDKPFGGQRFAEWKSMQYANEETERGYLVKFQETIVTLNAHTAMIPGVNVTYYKYPTMPAIRMFIVDDKEFLFTWFPVNEGSIHNVYIHVTDSEDTKHLTSRLTKQFKDIKRISTEVS